VSDSVGEEVVSEKWITPIAMSHDVCRNRMRGLLSI